MSWQAESRVCFAKSRNTPFEYFLLFTFLDKLYVIIFLLGFIILFILQIVIHVCMCVCVLNSS